MFDDVDERRKRRRRRKTKTKTKTKDENVDRKRTEEEKKFFKTNVLVPNKHFWERGRYRSGYTYLFSAGSFVRSLGRSGSVLPWKPSNFQQESPINYQKCPNYEKRNKKRRQSFQTFIFIDSPKQMKQMKQKECSWVWEQTKNIKNESNDTKQLFHSLFFRLNVHSKESNSLGEPCCS
jgi:hypothetical protein